MTSTNFNESRRDEETEAESDIATGNILREPRIRKRTEKGLCMELERAKKKRDKVVGTVNKRIRSVDILLKESEDIVKLTAGKDGLEMELDNLRSLQTEVMYILLENADEEVQSEEEKYFGVILNKALECLADVKIRIKDKEQERAELLSRKSDRSSNANSFITRSLGTSSKRISAARAELLSRKSDRSSNVNSFVTRSLSTSSKRISAARAEAAALRAKLDSLTKLQNIQRKQNELTRQKEELERLEEQERLQGELSAAVVIHKILQDTSVSCQSNERKVIPMEEPLSMPIKPKQDNVDAVIPSARTQFPVESRIPHRSFLDVNTPEFIPWDSKWSGSKQVHVPLQQSLEIPYPSQPYTNQWQVQQIQRENAEIQRQQVQLLERLTLPVPKPPVFEGDILEYPKWESAFDALIEEGTVKSSYKLYYLGEYTGGIAKKMVGGLLGLRSEDAYSRARKVLKERFGDPFKIYEAYREKLKTWPVCTTGGELQDYSDFLVMTRETMRTVKYLKEFNTFSAIRELAARSPIFYSNKWRESAKRTEASQGEYTFDNFVDFAQESSSDANHPVFSHEALAATRRQLLRGLKKDDKQTLKPQGRFPRGTAFKTTNEGEEREDNRLQSGRSLCFMCDEEHNLEDCKTFLKGTVAERVRFVKSKGLCFACLKKGHMVRQCQRKRKCQICKKPHVTVLHYDSPPWGTSGEIRAREENLKATSSCVSVCHASDSDGGMTTSSMIVPVWLSHRDEPNREVQVYAVLDDQSDTCFVTDEVCNTLGLSGPELILELGTMHAVENVSTRKIEGLVASRDEKSVKISLPKSYSREKIPVRREQIPRPELAQRWRHLWSIANKISPYREDLKIGILIGNNCVQAIKPRDVIPGRSKDPYAIRTVLGWGVIGAVVPNNDEDKDAISAGCYRIATREIDSDERKDGKFVHTTRHKEVINPSAVKKMFERDFSETRVREKPLSQDDIKFLKIMKDGIHLTEAGHYEMPLPLRDEKVDLPCNKKLAEIRLKCRQRRFDKSPKYKSDYVSFMNDTIKKGHAERAPKECNKVWYIPHHGVYNPKKPDKIRVVFDCSADFMGHSLNRHLLQGPDITNSLVGVLCRFRQEPVAFTCDIEGMFHQVNVNKEHRDFLRFLWWDEGDTTQEPKEYRMTVHLFGAASSPACTNLSLKTTAEDNKDLGEEVVDFVKTDFYVDDGLKSVDTVEKAVSLIQKGKEMCQRGGFRLHKFTSNNKEVIESIPVEDRAKGVKNLDLDNELLPLDRVLGVEWCMESDSFKFRITLKDKPLTRRGILSTVCSIYDPLGFAAPFLLRGKRILQLLCKEGVNWDDHIPDVLRSQWELWRRELLLLEEMNIPRCFKPDGFGNVKTTELHHFSDASVDGYGQCSYLRMVDHNDRIHCSLVVGKSRVNPLKPITIPRLELTAALVSVKVSEMLQRELRYDELKEFFWTDSQVVLAYIHNDTRRFKTYVANRVQQIRDHTTPNQWNHVESKHNPADDASRGLSVQNLLQSSTWLKGPAFLWELNQSWLNLNCSVELTELSPCDQELKKASSFDTSSKELLTLLPRLDYFSDWFRVKRALAICVRYLRILLDRVRVGKDIGSRKKNVRHRRCEAVTVEELRNAEEKIIKSVQREAFGNEFKALKSKNNEFETREETRSRKTEMRKKSDLYRLDPFVDEHGIIRVGGRIREASLAYEVKHPVILPRRGHISWLVMKNFHEKIAHQGRGFTINEIRSSGYWIVGCSTAVSKLILECTTCRKLRAIAQEQKMADLPQDRLEPAPPFSYCGVDYFGPWYVKEGRKELKRYGVLFTCMSSRAIHLEVASTMETDSFINSLRRFICRRGPIRQLLSDQGTNFIGARRELREAISEMDQTQVQNEMLKLNCDWIEMKFNTPSASHMGGVWERQIRTVRSILSAILEKNGTQLNDEALRTFMCEAEAIVNSRPLTAENISSPDFLEPLTPNHLLTMKSKVVLPPPGVFQVADRYSRKQWRRVQHLTNEFGSRWKKEFLHSLQERKKWNRPRRNMQVDDVVIIKDVDTPRNHWRVARIVEALKDKDGLVRKVKLAVGDSQLSNSGKRTKPMTVLERPIHKLVLILPAKGEERPGIPDEEP